MEHVEAIRAKTAEAYLLGELAADERRAFEEHFFDCQECTRDVEAGSQFIDAYKELPRREGARMGNQMGVIRPGIAVPRGPGGFRQVYALAASVLLAGVLLFQSMVTIPKLKQSAAPQALESFSLESAGSRGAEPTVIAPAHGKPFVILFDIPPGAEEREYLCHIRSESGAEAASFRVSATLAQRTIPVFIPATQLKTGKYALVIEGDQPRGSEAGDVIARYPFEIR